MKRCITTHVVPSFGTIPAGSLWADDSEFLVEPDNFTDVADPSPVDEPAPVVKPVRKFGAKR